MDRTDAAHILGLNGPFDGELLRRSHASHRGRIEGRIEAAPSEALKERYRRQLGLIDNAFHVLSQPSVVTPPPGLSQTMMADLPIAAPSYTRFDSMSPGAAGAVQSVPGFSPGTTVAGRYEIRKQIGAGGMGAVFEAFDRNKMEGVAIKVLLPHLTSNAAARERFQEEAKLSCRLSHPNIVNVFDVQSAGDVDFITMELLTGETLREEIELRKAARGQWSAEEALKIAHALCDALNYAHEHMVHRDIKPENIWLGDDGTVKLMDFGIVRLLSRRDMTRTRVGMGTAYYMAPEQLTGASEVDHRADQYSLGIVLYEMLAGQLPTGAAAPLRKLRKDLPQGLCNSVMKAISPDRADRHVNMVAFRKAMTSRSLGIPWRRAAAAALFVVVASGAVFTYPQWSTMLPFGKHAQFVREEAVRLQGVVEGLDRRLNQAVSEVDRDMAEARSDLETLERDLKSSRVDDLEKASIEQRVDETRSRVQVLDRIARYVRDEVSNSDEVIQLQSTVRLAALAQGDRSFARSVELYGTARDGYENLTQKVRDVSLSLRTEAKLKRDLERWSLLAAEFRLQEFPEDSDLPGRLEAAMQSVARADYTSASRELPPVALALQEWVRQVSANQVREILELAAAAETSNRLTEPVDDSAVFHYQRVLRLDPGNNAALEGLNRLVATLIDLARSATQRGRIEQANTLLTRAMRLSADPALVSVVQGEIAEARDQIRRELEQQQRIAEQKAREEAERQRQAEIERQRRDEETRRLAEQQRVERERVQRVANCRSSCQSAESRCEGQADAMRCDRGTFASALGCMASSGAMGGCGSAMDPSYFACQAQANARMIQCNQDIENRVRQCNQQKEQMLFQCQTQASSCTQACGY